MFGVILLAIAIASPGDVRWSDERQILYVIDGLSGLGGTRSYTWADATLTLSDLPKSSPDRKRLWWNTPTSEVNFQSHIEQSQVRIRGDRATAYVAVYGRIYLGIEDTGDRTLLYDYHVLERRQGEWRILSTVRKVRQYTNAAIRRRFESTKQ